MKTAEVLLKQVLDLLDAAEKEMMGLTYYSEDWTAREALRAEFETIKDSCRSFGKHQLGVNLPKQKKPRGKRNE